MSASHTVELKDLSQSAWPPYALLPPELDQQLRRYCGGNTMLLSESACFLLLKTEQQEKMTVRFVFTTEQPQCNGNV